jgi:multisubunit Na+/H+ antiporter MnhF subunit
MQTADIPTWLGILMFIVGLAMTVALAKYVARRNRRREEIKANSKA